MHANLAGDWLHSFEEDEGGVQVYRPAQFAFSPSRRGRESLTFDAQGQATIGTPGPDDRLHSGATRTQALGMNRYRAGNRTFEIVESRPDRLKLRFI
jgi:hypothetical protein